MKNLGIYFILINNNKNILPTLTSRCIKFNLSLSHLETISISEKLIDGNINNLINKDLIDYYSTPGKIYNLLKFSNENEVDLTKTNLKDLINIIINKNLYKKETPIKYFIYDYVELFLSRNIKLTSKDFWDNFIVKLIKQKSLI